MPTIDEDDNIQYSAIEQVVNHAIENILVAITTDGTEEFLVWTLGALEDCRTVLSETHKNM